jgi:hypothetical protein
MSGHEEDTPVSPEMEAKIHAALGITPTIVTPVDDNDFPLGKACDLSGEGTCEACQ